MDGGIHGWRPAEGWFHQTHEPLPCRPRQSQQSFCSQRSLVFAVSAVIVRSLQSPPFPPWRLFTKNLQISTILHCGPRQQIWQEPGMLYRWCVASEDWKCMCCQRIATAGYVNSAPHQKWKAQLRQRPPPTVGDAAAAAQAANPPPPPPPGPGVNEWLRLQHVTSELTIRSEILANQLELPTTHVNLLSTQCTETTTRIARTVGRLYRLAAVKLGRHVRDCRFCFLIYTDTHSPGISYSRSLSMYQ